MCDSHLQVLIGSISLIRHCLVDFCDLEDLRALIEIS